MLKDIIAKRYAKALISLAEGAGKMDAVKADLSAMAEAFRASRAVQSVFMNPSFTEAQRSKVLTGLCKEFKVSELSARFLTLLLEKGRFRYVREVSSAYSDLLDMKKGRVKAAVASACPLSDAELKKLTEKVKTLVGKDVELTASVEPALIGGVRATVGSTVYDGSLKNQIKLLKSALLK